MGKEKKQRAEEAANDLMNFVNSFSCDSKTFARTICHGHKTLQQSVMRLFVALAREMADTPCDARNEAAVELAKKISEIAEDHPLPFI